MDTDDDAVHDDYEDMMSLRVDVNAPAPSTAAPEIDDPWQPD